MKFPSDSVDLLATDPPYGISFMGKSWDKALPDINIWKECLRVLKPGAFAFVMSIPRADCLSRMIISLEDAGFNVGFSPVYWAYASGFPKAQNIGKAMDKRGRTYLFFDEIRDLLVNALNSSGLSVKQVNEHFDFAISGSGMAGHWFANITQQTLPTKAQYMELKQLLSIPDNNFDDIYREIEEDKRPIIGEGSNWGRASESLGIGGNTWNITTPYLDEAKALDGSYGGFQPKPAVEVIIVAMKPLSEKTYVDQALKNGKGITWLDDGRIPYTSEYDEKHQGDIQHGQENADNGKFFGGEGKSLSSGNLSGRFPANLLVSDDVLNNGMIDKGTKPHELHSSIDKYNGWGKSMSNRNGEVANYGDSGSFSRYFDIDKWWEERIKQLPASVQKTFPFLITPKASKSEKNKGVEGIEKDIGHNRFDQCATCGGYILQNPDRPSACKCETPVRQNNKIKGNYHPTTKPIKLMSYLITLGSREGGVVLDPFLGSGTTALACQMLNRKCIGIELKEEYAKIAKSRCQSVMRLGL